MTGLAAPADNASSPTAAPKIAPPPVSVAPKTEAAAPSPTPVQTAPAGANPALSPPAFQAPPSIGAAPPASSPPTAAGAAPPKPKKVAPPPPPLETALSTDPQPTFQPNTFFATAKASERYAAIVDAGGWPTDIVALRPGAKGPAVAELRKRLAIEGDLDATAAVGQTWDAELTAAVKRFQARMGLRQTGIVAGATLKAINVPARECGSTSLRRAPTASPAPISRSATATSSSICPRPRSRRSRTTASRIAMSPSSAIPTIPRPRSRRISRSSISIRPGRCRPRSSRRRSFPRMQRDPGYLTRAKIRILDGSGQEIDPKAVNWSTERAANYTLRQDSGAGNSLGSIRIGMPNKLAVYMHDTPSKRLFGADYRFLSHGCVRVQGVYDLRRMAACREPAAAERRLGQGGDAGEGQGRRALRHQARPGRAGDLGLSDRLVERDDGPANFRDDVYGLDTVGEAQASAATARPAQ